MSKQLLDFIRHFRSILGVFSIYGQNGQFQKFLSRVACFHMNIEVKVTWHESYTQKEYRKSHSKAIILKFHNLIKLQMLHFRKKWPWELGDSRKCWPDHLLLGKLFSMLLILLAPKWKSTKQFNHYLSTGNLTT